MLKKTAARTYVLTAVCLINHTFLNQRFKNAAIEPIKFTFGEGSIANRFIESRNTQ